MDSSIFAGAGVATAELAWFWVTSVSATFCALLSMVVVAAGWRRRLPDVGLVGTSLLALSLWSLAAGLLSPGPLFATAHAGPLAAAMAFPIGLLAATPLMFPRAGWSVIVVRRWRWLSAFVLAVTLSGSAVLLVRSNTDPDLAPWMRGLLVLCSAAGATRLIARQWYLHRIARTRSTAAATASISALALVALLNQFAGAGSVAGWFAVVVDNLGVLTAGTAMLVGYRQRGSLVRVLAPVMGRDPLGGFEAGLAPEVRAFVAALERKDLITQHHVIRTSAMALRVAERARLAPDTIRSVALGALLHDLGKLVIPSEILGKPSGLTDAEYAAIKTHPEQGERILRSAPGLSTVAAYVRGHHERPDGRGYPDGLRGDDVSFEVGIVSACDAWDAMTNTRQYRDGMSLDRAAEIMRQGAGTQWHPTAVELLLHEVEANGPVAEHEVLLEAASSAYPEPDPLAACVCEDAIETTVRHRLIVDVVAIETIRAEQGNDVAEQILSLVGHVIRSCTRTTDITERIGDQFSVTLEEADAATASQLATRITEAVARETTSAVLAGSFTVETHLTGVIGDDGAPIDGTPAPAPDRADQHSSAETHEAPAASRQSHA